MNQQDLELLGMMEMQAGWLGVPTPQVAPPDASAEDGLAIGLATLPAQVLHTPGHTPGSICLLFPDQHLLLAGDTLFAGSIGRPIFPGAMGSKSCARCVGACWCYPIVPVFFPDMVRRLRLGKKDNRIRSFSQNFECETLTSPKKVSKGEHKQIIPSEIQRKLR